MSGVKLILSEYFYVIRSVLMMKIEIHERKYVHFFSGEKVTYSEEFIRRQSLYLQGPSRRLHWGQVKTNFELQPMVPFFVIKNSGLCVTPGVGYCHFENFISEIS